MKGSLISCEIGDPQIIGNWGPGSLFHMKMGTRGPHFGGPHFYLTPNLMIICAKCKRRVESLENHILKSLKSMRNRLLKIHYTPLYYPDKFTISSPNSTSHDTEESENIPESPHLGEIKRMRSVYQALLRFSRAQVTKLTWSYRIRPSLLPRITGGDYRH